MIILTEEGRELREGLPGQPTQLDQAGSEQTGSPPLTETQQSWGYFVFSVPAGFLILRPLEYKAAIKAKRK